MSHLAPPLAELLRVLHKAEVLHLVAAPSQQVAGPWSRLHPRLGVRAGERQQAGLGDGEQAVPVLPTACRV